MKLYNKTKYPDSLIRPVLLLAAREAKTRSIDVVVKLTTSQHQAMVSGKAYDWIGVKEFWLLPRSRNQDGTLKKREIKCDGVIHISLPYIDDNPHDALDRVMDIYKLSVHEFAHITEYQQNNMFEIKRDLKDRRKHHDNRPWEKQADRVMNKAINKLKGSKQDCLLALAIYLESKQ